MFKLLGRRVHSPNPTWNCMKKPEVCEHEPTARSQVDFFAQRWFSGEYPLQTTRALVVQLGLDAASSMCTTVPLNQEQASCCNGVYQARYTSYIPHYIMLYPRIIPLLLLN